MNELLKEIFESATRLHKQAGSAVFPAGLAYRESHSGGDHPDSYSGWFRLASGEVILTQERRGSRGVIHGYLVEVGLGKLHLDTLTADEAKRVEGILRKLFLEPLAAALAAAAQRAEAERLALCASAEACKVSAAAERRRQTEKALASLGLRPAI